LQYIADAEKVPVASQVISALIDASSGDLRRAITYLQSTARLHAAGGDKEAPITSQDVQEIAGVVPDSVVRDFARGLGVDVQSTGEDVDMDEGAPVKKGFDAIRKRVKDLMLQGFSAAQLISQVGHRFILS